MKNIVSPPVFRRGGEAGWYASFPHAGIQRLFVLFLCYNAKPFTVLLLHASRIKVRDRRQKNQEKGTLGKLNCSADA